MIWRHLDLFSGIGGNSFAADMVWPEVEHIFCEIEPYCQAVLRKHWPHAKLYDNIKTYRGGSDGAVDLITAGFPCQPYSNAGKRKGTEDDRDLWPETFRIVREVRPRWLIAENVDGLVTWNRGMVLERILLDLASEGYGAQPFIIPAAAVQASHRRDRLWVVAHADGLGRVHGQAEKFATEGREHALGQSLAGGTNVADSASRRQQRGEPSDTGSGRSTQGEGGQQADRTTRRGENISDSPGERRAGRSGSEQHQERKEGIEERRIAFDVAGRHLREWPVEPDVGRVAHGVPNRVDRIKALGNSIVPQVAAEIMRAIKEVDA